MAAAGIPVTNGETLLAPDMKELANRAFFNLGMSASRFSSALAFNKEAVLVRLFPELGAADPELAKRIEAQRREAQRLAQIQADEAAKAEQQAELAQAQAEATKQQVEEEPVEDSVPETETKAPAIEE